MAIKSKKNKFRGAATTEDLLRTTLTYREDGPRYTEPMIRFLVQKAEQKFGKYIIFNPTYIDEICDFMETLSLLILTMNCRQF